MENNRMEWLGKGWDGWDTMEWNGMEIIWNLPEPCYPILFDDSIHLKAYSSENILTQIYDKVYRSTFLWIQQPNKQS